MQETIMVNGQFLRRVPRPHYKDSEIYQTSWINGHPYTLIKRREEGEWVVSRFLKRSEWERFGPFPSLEEAVKFNQALEKFDA